ncbi:MAG: hypothetical protein V3U92_11015 [Cellulophaga sp.]
MSDFEIEQSINQENVWLQKTKPCTTKLFKQIKLLEVIYLLYPERFPFLFS